VDHYIRRITAAGVVDTIAGSGGSCGYGAMCTLPNSGNTAPEPLPGVAFPVRIAVDPTTERLFFTTSDVTSVFTMPR
jgi:hypothetical protein